MGSLKLFLLVQLEQKQPLAKVHILPILLLEKNLNVPLTQPRRCSWEFSNGQQRREIWGENIVCSANRKLPIEPSITTENVQAQEIQDVKGGLIASPSLLNGDWKRSYRDMARLKDDSVIKFASQPWISVDRKRYDSYSDSMIHISQHVVNQSWRRDSCEDHETKKFAKGDSN